MKMLLLNTVAAACVVFIMIVAGCGLVAPEVKGNLSVENGTIVILVENTSVSLPVKQLEPGGDALAEFMRSVLNMLEGKSR